MKHQLLQPPVLIGGCGRSGTTLLLAILEAHPAIMAIPYESQAFVLRPRYEEAGREFEDRLNIIYSALAQQAPKASADRWCEKTPRNVCFLPAIMQLFGRWLRFIHIVRDGRDVVSSRHPVHSPEAYYVSPERWLHDVRIGLRYFHHPQVKTIRYEDLVRDFRATMQSVLDFLDLSWHDNLLNFHEHSRVREHIAWRGGLQKLSTEALGRWQRAEHHERIDEFLSTPGTRSLLRRLSYPLK